MENQHRLDLANLVSRNSERQEAVRHQSPTKTHHSGPVESVFGQASTGTTLGPTYLVGAKLLVAGLALAEAVPCLHQEPADIEYPPTDSQPVPIS